VLERRIGQGAYGEVWLARNALGTWRAVKIVYRDTFKDARPYEREFAGIRRFEPLSRSNEGFVDILQVGRNEEEGWFYYVMELAEPVATGAEFSPNRDSSSGIPDSNYCPRTLARELHRQKRLPLTDCLELGLTLSLALGHLHRHGLIHRDIKPSNIIFIGGIPKLADIGLVTEASEANTFVGTEGFVPPEGPTSPQADIYALGKVLYEAAMGKDRNEFPEPYTQIRADAESIALMELNSILLRACATDPRERYASAEELHADLALLHSGGSVKRRHQLERHFRVARRVGIIAAAAAILAGGAWRWQQRQTIKMTELAKANAVLAQERSTLSESLTKTANANRESLVRLRTATGLRTLEEGDPAGALLWFVNALSLTTNSPDEERIQRIRIQQTLNQTPRLLRIFPHDTALSSAVFSADGGMIATGTKDGTVRIWNTKDGSLVEGPFSNGVPMRFLRFTRDGRFLLGSSAAEQGVSNGAGREDGAICIIDLKDKEDSQKQLQGISRSFCIHFSPDDRWVAAAELEDHSIKVLSVSDQQLVARLHGHTAEVRYLSFSRDGSLMASASLDRTVRIWKLPSGEPVGLPLKHRWPVVRVLLTDDGSRAVTVAAETPGAGGMEIQLWDTATGEHLEKALRARDNIAVFLAPGSNGPLFLQDRPPNPLTAYHLDTLDEASLDLKTRNVLSWDFNNGGDRVVLGGDYRAQIFDLYAGGTPLSSFRHSRWGVNVVQFGRDGSTLLTGAEDGNARLWSLSRLANETIGRQMPGGLAPGWTYRSQQQFGRSPDRFSVQSYGGSVGVFTHDLHEIYRISPAEPGTDVIGPSRSPNGKFWAIRAYDQTSGNAVGLTLGIEEDGIIRKIELPHSAMILDSMFTPDSQYLISACTNEQIHFWSTSDGQHQRTIQAPESSQGEFREISPDGKTILFWNSPASKQGKVSQTIRFFDLDSETLIGAEYEASPTVFLSVFSPSGRYVALLDELGPVTILESRSGKVINSSIRHPASLTRLHWDFVGRRFLTVGRNDEVLVWDAVAGVDALCSLRSPEAIIYNGRWSPDGRFVVTTGADYGVRVWDVETGEMVTPPLKHDGILAAAFMTKSNRVISISYTAEELRAWDLEPTLIPTDLLVDYAKFLSGRVLDSAGTMRALTPIEFVGLDRAIRERAASNGLSGAIPFSKGAGSQHALNFPATVLNSAISLAELGRSNCLARQIPLRASDAPASLIDLSAFFDSSLSAYHTNRPVGPSYYNFLEALPHGIQALPNSPVLHDLRGAVHLARAEAQSRPQRVNDIPVGAKAHRLHFLQATAWSGRDGVEVGKYVIHFTDDTFEQVPVIYGEHIRDWVVKMDAGKISQGRVAWRGSNKFWGEVRLFLQTWENPRPDIEIKTIDFVSRMTECAPFLVAITRE
jgi:WD40 repeat protein/serine/threonine protein kinase